MYRVYTVEYFTALPLRDPLTISKWLSVEFDINEENHKDCMFDDWNEAINALRYKYNEKFYINKTDRGTYCLLCYIYDDDYNAIAAIDYDGTLLIKNGDVTE